MHVRPLDPAFRSVLLALAAIALLFHVASPPGTMVTDTGRGAAIVICTGHGPMISVGGLGKPPASRSHSSGSCEFAAHAANAVSARPLEFIGHADWRPFAPSRPIVLWTTGAGLAAPPPPSQAPPLAFV